MDTQRIQPPVFPKFFLALQLKALEQVYEHQLDHPMSKLPCLWFAVNFCKFGHNCTVCLKQQRKEHFYKEIDEFKHFCRTQMGWEGRQLKQGVRSWWKWMQFGTRDRLSLRVREKSVRKGNRKNGKEVERTFEMNKRCTRKRQWTVILEICLGHYAAETVVRESLLHSLTGGDW